MSYRKYTMKNLHSGIWCEYAGKWVFTKNNAKALIKNAKRCKHRREKSYYYCKHCEGYHVSSYEKQNFDVDIEDLPVLEWSLVDKDPWKNVK